MSDPRDNLVDNIPMVGEAGSTVEPGDAANDPTLYGHVRIEGAEQVETRSFQTFRMIYTLGRYGLDDTGAIRVAFRAMSDFGRLQMSDPTAAGYTSAKASNGCKLQLDYQARGHNRPRFKSLTVHVGGGYMREGDTIEIVFGDTSQGSPGMAMPTFVDPAFEFKLYADVVATGHFTAVPGTPAIEVKPGPPAHWRAVLSSLRRPGESFIFGVKAEDKWGNPTELAQANLRFETSLPVDGLPETFDYTKGNRAHTFEGLSCAQEGVLRIKVIDRDSGAELAESHPMVIRGGAVAGFWGDMHGQSGESIGVTTARHYFDFARNKSFLDCTSHQANDFQITNAFWDYLQELCGEFHEDGRFCVLPGYEWSGNTGVGGDRNVFFRQEGRQIHRSSHALLPDRADIHTDAPTANKLFEMLSDEDCCIYAHVGGRYADIAYAHDPKLETAMEIHSAWGTFEWLLTDGFPLGHRSGLVCNSDGHKGRPGASYPGAATFGAYGGLTCFLMDGLNRDSMFDCLRSRHHYGTTGTRMHLDIRAEFTGGAKLYNRDPNVFSDAKSAPATSIIMGDIAQTNDATATVRLEVITHAPIERIEVRNGTEVVQTLRGFSQEDLGSRFRVIWSGAEYRGRGRQSIWRGRARFGGSIINRLSRVNAWNLERRLEQHSADAVVFDALTTGNFGGFDVWVDEDVDGMIEIETNHGSLKVRAEDVGMEDVALDAGGLERRLRIFRLPEENNCREFRAEIEVPLKATGDNQLWVCVTTEDGFQAWSSPMFVFREG
jgi:hypothetical protein